MTLAYDELVDRLATLVTTARWGYDQGREGLTVYETIEVHAVASLAGDPTIHEPTEDPDDDIEAEVPDVREDPVPE